MDKFTIKEIKNPININLKQVYTFKIVVVGDCAVGKSNLLSRFSNNEFFKESKSTIGCELTCKFYKINETVIKVNLWDTAGQERYKSVTSTFYKGARGAMIVYDLTRKETFNNLERWLNEIKESSDKNLAILLVGNKRDLNLLRQVNYELGYKKAEELKMNFLETSALDNTNVEEAFKNLIFQIYNETIKNNLKERKDSSDNYEMNENSGVYDLSSNYKSVYSSNLNFNSELETKNKSKKCQC